MRIYLATFDAWDEALARPLQVGQVRHIFYSYFIAVKSRLADRRLAAMRGSVESIIIDSGAYSYFTRSLFATKLASGATHRNTNLEVQPPDVYFREYLAWLLKNKSSFDYFVELDLGEMVGQPQVNLWRQQMIDAGLGSKLIPVWHPATMDEDEFKRMALAAKSRFVALQGLRRNVKAIPYRRITRWCYDNGIKVHCFAMTKNKWMERVPFYSVDSSSWRSVGIYGSMRVWDRGRLVTVDTRERRHMEPLADQLNVVKARERGKAAREPLYEASIRAMIQAEDHWTSVWKARGVDWDDIEQRD